MTRCRSIVVDLFLSLQLLLLLLQSALCFVRVGRSQRHGISVLEDARRFFDSPSRQVQRQQQTTDWDAVDESLQDQAISFTAQRVRERLKALDEGDDSLNASNSVAANHFVDLACTIQGEHALESLLVDTDKEVLGAAIQVIQSLCILGLRWGVVGTPQGGVAPRSASAAPAVRSVVQRRKQQQDVEAGTLLLAELGWKRTPSGAFRLLHALGAWDTHENLELLRSGLPVRFLPEEEVQAAAQPDSVVDIDAKLGIRQDLTHLKVYTIDPVHAEEIDDGLSIETLEDGTCTTTRIWIHIADADHWAPRESAVFDMARQRITSVYLPNQTTCSMFPPQLALDTMSLREQQDCFALSVGVELNVDGSIDASSIVVTPSTIRITYRLTYQEANEMLEEGIGYDQEWQLGALMDAATARRAYRVQNGSLEGKIETRIPFGSVTIVPDATAPDNRRLALSTDEPFDAAEDDESLSKILVTETMVLAGEAMGRWKLQIDRKLLADDDTQQHPFVNQLRLPFRSQTIDFNSRPQWQQTMRDLLEYNIGGGLCHSWFVRRFMEPVVLSEVPGPHNGLGLDCYVQWTSPIRRFGDLQVHTLVKRQLRRQRLLELVAQDENLPAGLDLSSHFGLPSYIEDKSSLVDTALSEISLDADIDLTEGGGYIGVARRIQRQAQTYWMLQYILREMEADAEKTFSALVLGCVNPKTQQYAVFLEELGLESRYVASAEGGLNAGDRLKVRAQNIQPMAGSMQLVRSM